MVQVASPEVIHHLGGNESTSRTACSALAVPVAAIEPTAASPSHASSRSVEDWHASNETFILLDWDDTLCPTSHFSSAVCAKTRYGDRNPSLVEFQAGVIDLLRTAAALGGVGIVTMACQEWVQECIQTLMPEVGGVLRELGIEVVSARTSASKQFLRESQGDAREPAHFLKRKAMARVIKKFYREPNFIRRTMRVGTRRSWKNIISIGDSQAERLALQDIVFQHTQRDRYGRCKECRCKTLLLMQEPNIQDLIRQHRAIREGLAALVRHDGDIDIEFAQYDIDLLSGANNPLLDL
jgi:hypothetical protein